MACCHINETLNITVCASHREYSVVFWSFLFSQSFVTIIANIMLCWLFYANRSLQTKQNLFIVNLSISDLLVGLTVPPCEYCAIQCPISISCQTTCGSILSFNLLASVINLILIAADRYCSIKYPFHYQEVVTKSRILFIIAVAWVLSIFLVCIPFSWLMSLRLTFLQKIEIGQIYSGVMFGVVMFIGFLLLIMYHSIISIVQQKLRAANERCHSLGLKACIVVAVSFFICWIPQSIMELCMQSGHMVPLAFQNGAYFIMLMNPCLNPLCYGYYRRDYRSELQKWVKRRWRDLRHIGLCIIGRPRITRDTWRNKGIRRYDMKGDTHGTQIHEQTMAVMKQNNNNCLMSRPEAITVV